MASSSFCSFWAFSCFMVLMSGIDTCMCSSIRLGSTLLASENQTWNSDNGTFAFGFTPSNPRNDQFRLAIWFAQLPGDRTLVWSAYIKSPVSKSAILEFDTTGNLLLTDNRNTVWTSNTSNAGVETAVLSENGNFILYGFNSSIVWQSFAHPSDTLLPGQPLSASLELTSTTSPAYGGFYTLKMLQQTTSLSLALTYNLPEYGDMSPDLYANFSYWAGPDISNATGNVVAILDDSGSFGITYDSSSDGAVYVYKNDGDKGGLSSAINQTIRPSTLRRLTLEMNGNLRLYRWDDDVNGSRQWVAEWAAVSNPCDIAGICGNGICSLDRSKTIASCTCLPGSDVGNDGQCWANSSLTGKCGPHNENLTSQFKISTVQDTNYYFSESTVIANYSDGGTVSKCGDACLSYCDCVASVYGLNEEKPYCWILGSLEFGGFADTGSTLFVKVQSNGSSGVDSGGNRSSGHSSDDSEIAKKKVLVVPIVLSMVFLVLLLCCLLYFSVHRKRAIKRALENSLILSGAPINFSYRDLQLKTNNFSHLIGSGGFGSVYRGSLGDGTLIAVKKLDRVLPHGQKEFITEVNTISSMHHMNLVRLCGYCSEGTQRLLVYEFMKNGSLDKWIFPSYDCEDRLLDWSTRFNIALGTAQGIAYFHEQCRDRIIHCDIKPENILLDENFCPKVSDFGLAKMMGREHSQVVTMIRGTRGYLAPEWVSNRPITVRADVYSYGMLLLEIIGGRRNLDMTYDAEDFFFPGWAFKELSNGTALKVADRRMEGVMEEEELTVLELIEEGLDHVYKAMRREFNQFSSFTITTHPSSRATCSNSTIGVNGKFSVPYFLYPQCKEAKSDQETQSSFRPGEFTGIEEVLRRISVNSTTVGKECKKPVRSAFRFPRKPRSRERVQRSDILFFTLYHHVWVKFVVWLLLQLDCHPFSLSLTNIRLPALLKISSERNTVNRLKKDMKQLNLKLSELQALLEEKEAQLLLSRSNSLLEAGAGHLGRTSLSNPVADTSQEVMFSPKVLHETHAPAQAFDSSSRIDSNLNEIQRSHDLLMSQEIDPEQHRDEEFPEVKAEFQETFLGHTSPISRCRFSASGDNIASASQDGTVRIWTYDSSVPASRNATIYCGAEVLSLEWDCKSDRLLLIGTNDGSIKAWNVDAKRVVCDLNTAKEFPSVLDIKCSPVEPIFVSASASKGQGTNIIDSLGFASLTVWNMRTWKAMTVLPLGEDPPAITSLCFNHNGKLLAAAAVDGMIHMFDMSSGLQITGWPAHDSAISSVLFGPDETSIFSLGTDGKVLEWSLQNQGKVIWSRDCSRFCNFPNPMHHRNEMALDANGRKLLLTSCLVRAPIYQVISVHAFVVWKIANAFIDSV
ncbi:OLC1v1027544C1 [Oldenlandia corymbosa var. corymbosa]|uniref:OLC1v1027544C1 n=1 Tax=Oldenlandia corymbosa var. corymbosa TaxID=529605 RepID=A0AAV1CCZ4_OLDCO|nr:OLC1v1027544C1 [Oldenlandia corymbosa var. corymbosa]